MEQPEQIPNTLPFNEEEWLRLVFLLNDSQNWLNDLIGGVAKQVPIKDKRRLFRKTYYLTVPALTHIAERHYYKIMRHPEASKFTIPFVEILSHLRDASTEPTTPVSGSLLFQRVFDVGRVIGFDRGHYQTSLITILTDGGGRIITAFPGTRFQ
jgi:hypothetical protein